MIDSAVAASPIASFTALQEVVEHAVTRDGGGVAWAISVGSETMHGSAGRLDPGGAPTPMVSSAIFRVASVSKPIVAVAALQLVQAGLFSLDEPVDRALPELADRRVLLDPTGPIDGPTIPAVRPVTLEDLLTFRCGLGMDFDFDTPQPVLEHMWQLGVGPGPTPLACPPDEFMALIGGLPLSDQPGTRWRYHTGSDLLSVLIERVRNEPLDVLLARDVFEPCGMTDTSFWVVPDDMGRLGSCRMGREDGELVVWDAPDGRWSAPPVFRSGAAGLVSTTADLIAFGRMLLAGGQAPGGPVLDAELIRWMTTDHLDDEQRALAAIDEAENGRDALGWGLGLGVRHRAAQAGWPTRGTYGWDGGLGSRWVVDPARDLCAVVLSTDAFESVTGPPEVVRSFTDALARLCT